MEGQFNRVIYLASLRDSNTARYHHYGLESRYESEVVDKRLRQSHIKIFEELMTLSIQGRTA